MMKRKRFYVFLILTLAWMCLIFSFSAKPADESEEDSHRVGKMVGKLLYDDFDSWTEAEKLLFEERVDYPIRKAAHASEFALLGVLIFLTVSGYGEEREWSRKRWILSWLLATAYAGTDEFHQLFIEGRSCQITDVMIDSGGVVLGLFLLFIMKNIYVYLRNRNYESK